MTSYFNTCFIQSLFFVSFIDECIYYLWCFHGRQVCEYEEKLNLRKAKYLYQYISKPSSHWRLFTRVLALCSSILSQLITCHSLYDYGWSTFDHNMLHQCMRNGFLYKLNNSIIVRKISLFYMRFFFQSIFLHTYIYANLWISSDMQTYICFTFKATLLHKSFFKN